MNGLDLLFGMNRIDDELIDSFMNSKQELFRKEKQTIRYRWRFAAAACLFALVSLLTWILLDRKQRSKLPTEHISSEPTIIFAKPIDPDPYGIESRDKLQFEKENYWRDYKSVYASIQENWVYVGKILSYAESQWDFTGDFQANNKLYVGCRLYRENSHPGELWLAYEGQYLHFIAERYIPSWIFFDGKLYLTENWLELIGVGTPPSVHVTAPPEDAIDLGSLIYNSEDLLPGKNLETNAANLHHRQVYFSSDLGCLLVEIPTPDGAQFWYYYPVDPEAFVKETP